MWIKIQTIILYQFWSIFLEIYHFIDYLIHWAGCGNKSVHNRFYRYQCMQWFAWSVFNRYLKPTQFIDNFTPQNTLQRISYYSERDFCIQKRCFNILSLTGSIYLLTPKCVLTAFTWSILGARATRCRPNKRPASLKASKHNSSFSSEAPDQGTKHQVN